MKKEEDEAFVGYWSLDRGRLGRTWSFVIHNTCLGRRLLLTTSKQTSSKLYVSFDSTQSHRHTTSNTTDGDDPLFWFSTCLPVVRIVDGFIKVSRRRWS